MSSLQICVLCELHSLGNSEKIGFTGILKDKRLKQYINSWAYVILTWIWKTLITIHVNIITVADTVQQMGWLHTVHSTALLSFTLFGVNAGKKQHTVLQQRCHLHTVTAVYEASLDTDGSDSSAVSSHRHRCSNTTACLQENSTRDKTLPPANTCAHSQQPPKASNLTHPQLQVHTHMHAPCQL